jgi:hypothetical protein
MLSAPKLPTRWQSASNERESRPKTSPNQQQWLHQEAPQTRPTSLESQKAEHKVTTPRSRRTRKRYNQRRFHLNTNEQEQKHKKIHIHPYINTQRKANQLHALKRFGFWNNPKLPLWLRCLQTLGQLSIPKLISLRRSTKPAYHNLCTTLTPPANIHLLLGLGLKFNLEQAVPKPRLDAYFERLKRDIRTKFHVSTDDSPRTVVDRTGRILTLKSPGYDPKLYIKSQDYEPQEATPELEQAIDHFESEIRSLVQHNKVNRRHDLPASLQLLIKSL